jgi:hypothetical protein
VAQAAIAPDIHQALDVHRDFAAKVTLDAHFLVDDLAQAIHFIVSKFTHTGIWVDAVRCSSA